jgi:GTP-binding protein
MVLTKADAVKPAALAKKQDAVVALAAEHPAAIPQILTTSSNTGLGMDQLRASIAAFCKD